MLVVTLVFGILPGFAWLVFYLKEDMHPEPKRFLVLAFFSGIAFGFFSVAVEQLLGRGLGPIGIEELSIISLIALALIEEFAKFGAAYLAVGKSEVLDEPIDRMIYMVVAALGFATLENIGAITNIPAPMQSAAFLGTFFQTASLRFVGATLLHTLTAAIIGYHWALGVARGKVGRNLAIGFVVATALHALFNYLILSYGDLAYTILLLVLIGLFVLNDFEKLRVQSPVSTTIS